MRKIIVPILALFFMSCEEDLQQAADSASAIEVLTEYATVNKVFQDVGNNNGDAVLSAESSASASKTIGTKTDGPTITISPLDFTTFPKTITIDYKTGVMGLDLIRIELPQMLSIFPGVKGSAYYQYH